MKGLALYWDGYGLGAPNSGVHVHARNLAAELASAGIKPTLVAGALCLGLFPELEPLSVPMTGWLSRLESAKPIWPRAVMRKIVESRRATQGSYIVHGLSNFNIPTGRGAGGLRRVLTVHDLIPLLTPRVVSKSLALQLGYLMPRAIAAADRIVCVSDWTRRTLVERFPAAEGKTRVILNGVGVQSTRTISPKPRSEWVEILFVARFEPYKGHAELLRLVRMSRLPLRATFITDSRGESVCRAQAQDLIDGGRLFVRQNVFGNDLDAAYANADVYVSPSQYEGFCLPAVEAMASGVPVVYRSGSGIDEVAGQSVNVPVLAPTSVEAWDAALSLALERRSAANFSALLSAHLDALPTWKDAASQLISLYHELV